ncbi:MAG: YdcF family protein, partial [Actinomycetia bacterium]|nr:YdcF family protein [Actinomycetes bacterium]
MIRRLIKVGLLVALVVVGYFAVTFVQVWSASRRDDARPSQAIIVLGAAQYNGTPSPVLKARLDHAAKLYEAKIAPVIVLTGGRR